MLNVVTVCYFLYCRFAYFLSYLMPLVALKETQMICYDFPVINARLYHCVHVRILQFTAELLDLRILNLASKLFSINL